MDIKTQVNIILGLIAFRILVSLQDVFSPDLDFGILHGPLFILFRLLDILILLFFYKFVTKINDHKLSFWPFSLILVAIGLSMISQFLPEFRNSDDMTHHDSVLNSLLASILPFIIQLIGQLVLASQLVKNTTDGKIRKPIKLVGRGYQIEIILGILLPLPIVLLVDIVGSEWAVFFAKIPALIHLIPWLAMLNLYLKDINSGDLHALHTKQES